MAPFEHLCRYIAVAGSIDNRIEQSSYACAPSPRPHPHPHISQAVVMQRHRRHHYNEYLQASPLHRVEGADEVPPFFIVHGDADTLVPASDARHFYEALQRRRKLDQEEAAKESRAAPSADDAAVVECQHADVYVQVQRDCCSCSARAIHTVSCVCTATRSFLVHTTPLMCCPPIAR